MRRLRYGVAMSLDGFIAGCPRSRFRDLGIHKILHVDTHPGYS